MSREEACRSLSLLINIPSFHGAFLLVLLRTMLSSAMQKSAVVLLLRFLSLYILWISSRFCLISRSRGFMLGMVFFWLRYIFLSII